MPHLTQDQRCQIYTLMQSGSLPQEEIAKIVGASQATVSREITRNSGQRGYRYKQAHEKSVQRRVEASSCPRKMKTELICIIERMICDDQLSPEQISGRLKKVTGIKISHESIYLHIWKDKRNGGILYKNLRRCGKKYNKRKGKTAGRGLIPNRVGIEKRPLEVDKKTRVGDLEIDSIVGLGHRGAIISIVDRMTKFTFLCLVSGTKADEVAQATIAALVSIKEHLHTITSDNGKEFARHQEISLNLGVSFFFATPYHSWERGLNENTNGLVRQYFPKGCDFNKLTQEQVLKIEKKLNNRPRKTLGYSTPNEEFLRLTGTLPNYAFRG
jgi:transposase, IS30 family